MLAVPLRAVPDLPSLDGKLVVDANNYYPGRDGQIAEIDDGMSSSRWVANQQPRRDRGEGVQHHPVAQLLADGRPHGDQGRLAIPLAADDDAAKATVSGLIDALGFDPVDAGGLDDSRRQEPGTPVYGADLDAERSARSALVGQRGGGAALLDPLADQPAEVPDEALVLVRG